ncbi:MAG TPA: serine hydrolase domain-containing protein [Caulobacteraceae bacterium]|nr:serine hydrolase domain-containing protein [Caulobacteraceae bacterium]
MSVLAGPAASPVLAQSPFPAHPVPAPAAAAPAPAAAPPRPGARLAPGQPIPPAELEAFVDGVVADAMAHDHIAGVTVSVTQFGQVALKKGYGAASRAPWRPVDPDRTLFRIGSISKTFTWILVLRQVEAGHMRLDAPVNLYLPDALRIHDQGFSNPIRVEDLMDHRPGFEDRVLGQLFEKDAARVRPLTAYLREERPRRVREPGTSTSYSNYGAALAGEAVSEVTGKPYESLVESEITGPLGMAHTTFREPHPRRQDLAAPMPAALAADVAVGYHWTPAGFQARPFEFIEQVAPAGAGSSTAGDMARYMLTLSNNGALEGAQVYGPITAQAFSTPQPHPPGVPAWRHGLIEYPLSGGFTGVGHSGGTLSFLSNMVIIPDLNLGVFVSTNTDTGGPLATTLPDRIVQRFYASPPAAPPAPSRALADDRAAFEGVYLSERRAYHGLEGFVMHLINLVTVRTTPDGRLLLAGGDGVSRFAPAGPPAAGRFVSEDGPTRLVFQMQNGRAVRFFTPAVTFDRVGPLQQTGPLILLTLLTAVAALATLGGVILRLRRDHRETSTQQRASLLQTSQAVLWLMAMAMLAFWALGAGDIAQVIYGWPQPAIVFASACALVAAIMAIVTLGLTPLVWRGGRRVDSWTPARKLRFTMTAVIFLAYGVLLFFWGALEPWSG